MCSTKTYLKFFALLLLGKCPCCRGILLLLFRGSKIFWLLNQKHFRLKNINGLSLFQILTGLKFWVLVNWASLKIVSFLKNCNVLTKMSQFWEYVLNALTSPSVCCSMWQIVQKSCHRCSSLCNRSLFVKKKLSDLLRIIALTEDWLSVFASAALVLAWKIEKIGWKKNWLKKRKCLEVAWRLERVK